MSITKEMQELLKEIQYKKNGKFDTAIYRICSKFYRREKLKEEERIYIAVSNLPFFLYWISFNNSCISFVIDIIYKGDIFIPK